VQRAVDEILKINDELILMQCNTNYTASSDNFEHIHLNVLRTYASLYPEVVLGLSDHTPQHATVLGAYALGARAIEKHFTDDTSRIGPDHPFSMDPDSWRAMVDRTRELEKALGSPNKQVAENELETVVIQQRCLRAARDIKSGEIYSREMIDVLRPAPEGSIRPYEIDALIGKKAVEDIPEGSEIRWPEVVE
jgi:N-acetylneuraminate synthase